MKTRRGFLGALLGLLAAPWARKTLPPDAITFRGVPVIPDPGNYDELLDVARFDARLAPPEVFHGSFKIGEITRRARESRLQDAFDRLWDHQRGLLDERVRETTKALDVSRETGR